MSFAHGRRIVGQKHVTIVAIMFLESAICWSANCKAWCAHGTLTGMVDEKTEGRSGRSLKNECT